MYSKVISFIIGAVLLGLFAYNLNDRKTIVLNSSRMKKLNNNIIKVDNRCYRLDRSVEKCETKEEN
tara:strand:- start:252 stop:449 length:198 start_codon:yes stop_codon:yes gene_type:complete